MVGGGNQPQTRGDTAGRKMQPRLFSSVVKAKPIAALFPSNEILAQGMAATTVSTEKSVMLLLQKDMMPVEVGVALALAGVPMPHIISMFAVDQRRINVMFNSPETTARFMTEYYNNKANIQQKMKIAERRKTKFILLSCVPGDFSDEELIKQLFGTNPPRIDSIYHERCPNEDGKMMWLTGRRFLRIPEEDFKKLNLDFIPTSIQLAPGFRVLVKLEGMALRCHHCHETTHKLAVCPNKDKPKASVSAIEALGLGLSDSSDSSSEDDEEEETPNISDDQTTKTRVDEQLPPKNTDVTQDTTQDATQETPVLQSTPIAMRTRRNTYNPSLRTNHPSFTLPPPDTPTKTILEKSLTRHNVTTEKSPTHLQLNDLSYRVKMMLPQHTISPPTIWKQAPENTLTYKVSQYTLIDTETIKQLIKHDKATVTTWTPNINLLRSNSSSSYPLIPFDPDIAFAPDHVYQFWEPAKEQEPHTYYTYYSNQTL